LTSCLQRGLPEAGGKNAQIFEDYCGDMPRRELPSPTFFIDSSSEEFISKWQETATAVKLAPRLTFLGGCGVAIIQGLRIAFLSGCYHKDDYVSRWGAGDFQLKDGRGRGAHYTVQAIEEVQRQAQAQGDGRVDMLLTSEWPDRFWSTALNKEAVTPVEARHTSPAVRQLFFKLKPRYHVCSKAGQYKYRKAPQGPHGFVCTSVCLAAASLKEAPLAGRATSDADAAQWHHVLTMRPDASETTKSGRLRRPSEVPGLVAPAEVPVTAAPPREAVAPPPGVRLTVWGSSEEPCARKVDPKLQDLLCKYPGRPPKRPGHNQGSESVAGDTLEEDSDGEERHGWETAYDAEHDRSYFFHRASGRWEWAPEVGDDI